MPGPDVAAAIGVTRQGGAEGAGGAGGVGLLTDESTADDRRTRLERWITEALRWIALVALATETVVICIDIVGRNLSNYYIVATEDLGRLVVLVVGMLGAAVAVSHGEHVAIRVLPARRDGWWGMIDALRHVAVGGLATMGAVSTVHLMRLNKGVPIPTLPISQAMMDLPLLVAFAAMALICLLRLARVQVRCTLVVVAVLICLYLYAAHLRDTGALATSNLTILVGIGIAAALMVLGVPLAFALAIGAVVFVFITNVTVEDSIVTNIESGISNFVLLSVPFFIATGLIMSAAGVSRRLSEIMAFAVSRVRGGLWDVMIASMFVFSGISGSKAADTAGVGTSMEPMLRHHGYDADESAAVLAAAAAAGETIPPSTVLIVLGTVTSLSIAALFAAGIVPALFISVGLAIIVHLRNRKRAFEPQVAVARPTARQLLAALPAICIPIILVGGIVLGVGTPTEVAGASTVLAVVVAVLVYGERSGATIIGTLKNLIALNGSVLFLIGAASAFAYVLAIAQVPEAVTSLLTDLGLGAVGFVVITAIILMIFGGLLEGLPAVLIFGPILLPMAKDLGINEVQYAISFLVALGTGCVIPPIGIVINIAAKVLGGRVEATFRAMFVYATWLMVAAVIIGLVPVLSLGLPHLLGIRV